MKKLFYQIGFYSIVILMTTIIILLIFNWQGTWHSADFNHDEQNIDGGYASLEEHVYPAKGKTTNASSPPSIQGTLIWPLKANENFEEFEYYYISNYVDIDSANSANGNVLDYNCGCRSYDIDVENASATDTIGYDHDGIDIALWPFPYYKMANEPVDVIAAVKGEIITKTDGNEDTNCTFGTGRTANTITLQHVDGSTGRYTHLKKNSLSSKVMGDTIYQGEYIGQVGSSGNSTGPHLHFELRDMNGNLIDPFFGPCSDQANVGLETTASWWVNQKPYFDTHLNALITHSGTPVFSSCDNTDSTAIPGIRKAKDVFAPGDSIVFGAYFTLVDDTKDCTGYVYQPDDMEFTNIDYTFPSSSDDPNCPNKYRKRSSWTNKYELPNDAQEGTWRFVVNFCGTNYTKYFYVETCPANRNLTGNISDPYFKKASNSITSDQMILNSPNTEVYYHAGNQIDLNLGFRVQPGSKFRAKLTNCAEEPGN